MKKLFTILFILISTISFAQVLDLSINDIRGNDTTEGGCSDYFSQYVTTTGVVYGPNFGISFNGIQMSLIDRRSDTLLSNRSGIGIYKPNQNLPISLNEGDSLRVWGQVLCFYGLSQINVDSVKLLKQNCFVSTKTVQVLNEVTECDLIKLLNCEFIPSTWVGTGLGSGFNARAFTGIPGTNGYREHIVRIDTDCDIFGQPMPQGKVDIVGLGGQFDPSIPRDSEFQIFPRNMLDITPSAPQELPVISFQDTLYTIDEGVLFVLPIISSVPFLNQSSCLMISEDISADSSDYSLQSPALVTFPTGQSTTNFGITLFTDQISEADEEFLIKLKKTGNDYKLGQDSVCKIRIIGTLSVKNLKDFDLYKNSFDGTFNVKLPNDFNGTVVVYNNLGQEIITTSNTDVNQDLRKLTTQPNGVYRVMIHSKNKRIAKTIFN